MRHIQRALLGAATVAAAIPAAARAQQAGETGAFVLRQRGDTLAVESFRRTPTQVEGEIAARRVARIVYVMRTGTAAEVTGMELRAWAPTAPDTAQPMQRVTVTWAGDSAVVNVAGAGGQSLKQVVKGAAGAIPIVNPSAVALEQVMMRARRLGGDSVSVPVFLIGSTQVLQSKVVFRGDSVFATIGPVVHAAVDAQGRVRGAAIPSQSLTMERVASASTALAPPDYSAPAGAPYTAQEVRVPHPAGHQLAGTLTLPTARSGRIPAVVTITGSGQEDRDEAIALLPGYRPFRQVADTLGRRGIAVLRMDDRGYGASGGNAATSTSRDFASDIAAAVAYLRTRPEIDPDRIALVGHSEGGIIAPMVAVDDPRIRAVVLMAGTSRTGRRIMEYQIRTGVEQDTTISAAKRDSAYRAGWAELNAMGARMPWLPFFLSYDPLPTARRVRQPVLVLQGETDRQVTPDQAPELAAAFRAGGNRDVTLRVLPQLNHLFVHDPAGWPAGYIRLPSNKVDAGALGILADWLATKLR